MSESLPYMAFDDFFSSPAVSRPTYGGIPAVAPAVAPADDLDTVPAGDEAPAAAPAAALAFAGDDRAGEVAPPSVRAESLDLLAGDLDGIYHRNQVVSAATCISSFALDSASHVAVLKEDNSQQVFAQRLNASGVSVNAEVCVMRARSPARNGVKEVQAVVVLPPLYFSGTSALGTDWWPLVGAADSLAGASFFFNSTIVGPRVADRMPLNLLYVGSDMECGDEVTLVAGTMVAIYHADEQKTAGDADAGADAATDPDPDPDPDSFPDPHPYTPPDSDPNPHPYTHPAANTDAHPDSAAIAYPYPHSAANADADAVADANANAAADAATNPPPYSAAVPDAHPHSAADADAHAAADADAHAAADADAHAAANTHPHPDPDEAPSANADADVHPVAAADTVPDADGEPVGNPGAAADGVPDADAPIVIAVALPQRL
ncbi:hypothetical protein I4F81_010525 [Pyropia yezoensis]|uniref:Uncharacterized protein n=1 Tax=Pyropia yezoensis TaxID=2788 RepID=A0ACC3CD62_PYRYE|nr:hypothetical protein I4F81_010525 [Neopyropia yezoensis]